MENIVYKIENGYPIIDYPPALDETFKAGTKEIVDGVEVFTPQELQDAITGLVIEQAKGELKQAKEVAKANIKVTTSNGNTFDGNMEARVNMQNAITASEILGQTTTNWKLADNSAITVDVTEIKEALALSIQECGRIVMVTSIEEL